jgi:hypothetical protein
MHPMPDKIASRIIWMLYCIGFAIAPAALANETHPNGAAPEPGWGLWRSRAEIPTAGFSGGFSNMELGGFLDFEHFCAQALGIPTESTPYWFRLSHSIQHIGTGTVEFGCWQNGKFINTLTNTAVSTQVDTVTCLRLRVPNGQVLRIRAEPGLQGKIVGIVPNGATVKPSSFPAFITLADGRNWIAIDAPRPGWISNDRPDTAGNLTLCQ